jgi:hypothetical protein
MGYRGVLIFLGLVCAGLSTGAPQAQTAPPSPSSSSNSSRSLQKPGPARESELDAGAVSSGVYRNPALALSCKIPPGWVLRTDEMNRAEAETPPRETSDPDRAAALKPKGEGNGCPGRCGRVLLAAFSRPPEAHGEDVNASLLIAAESVQAYPGLKEAVQYFAPLTEVAKAEGFTVDEEPYELALGSKVLVRGDFHKDVGTRVMRQSTLAWLAHGYALSITVIGGTEDEVEELIDGIEFRSGKSSRK